MLQTRAHTSSRQAFSDAGLLSAYRITPAIASGAMVTVPNEITVLELQHIMRNSAIRHEEAYMTVLERCYTRIRRCASVRVTECTFDVPSFIPGLPLYDNTACRDYTVQHLLKNGFQVSHNGLSIGAKLSISWRPQGPAFPQYAPPPPLAARGATRSPLQAPVRRDPPPPPPPPRPRNLADFRAPVRFD